MYAKLKTIMYFLKRANEDKATWVIMLSCHFIMIYATSKHSFYIPISTSLLTYSSWLALVLVKVNIKYISPFWYAAIININIIITSGKDRNT